MCSNFGQNPQSRSCGSPSDPIIGSPCSCCLCSPNHQPAVAALSHEGVVLQRDLMPKPLEHWKDDSVLSQALQRLSDAHRQAMEGCLIV